MRCAISGKILAVFLLMAILTHTLFAFVRSNFMAFSFFSARHLILRLSVWINQFVEVGEEFLAG
jgi:hypothetical protein